MLKSKDITGMMNEIYTLLDSNKDYLCRLDGSLGDGDIGITMSKGFSSIVNFNKQNTEIDDIGLLMKNYGLILAENAPSTMGTLLASGFLHASKEANGKKQITQEEFISLIEDIIIGIQNRGKAELGDKTILDALIPAKDALKRSTENKDDILTIFENAYKAAHDGMLSTIDLQARRGRASRYLEKSQGKQDPGATVGMLMFEGFLNYID